MTRSEYNQLVSGIVEKTQKELSGDVTQAFKENGPGAALAKLTVSVPDTVAHLVSDILIQTGVLSLEEDEK